jgi:PAS domain S-box-containing protein
MPAALRPQDGPPRQGGWKRLTTVPAPLVSAVLIGVLSLALIGIEGWWTWSARSVQLAATRVAAVNLVQLIAQHAAGAFDAAGGVLAAAVERMEADGDGPSALQRMHRQLAARVAELPALHEVLVVGADGRWLASSLDDAPADPASRYESLAAYHRMHAGPASTVGGSGHSARDGRPLLTLSRRFDHADGSFAGVVEAVFDLDDFLELYRRLNVGAHGTVSLWRDDGTLLVRQPPAGAAAGRSAERMDERLRTLATGSSGTFDIAAAIDGEQRIYAYQRLAHFPLIVFDGVATSDALSAWRADALIHAAGLALLLTIVALASWRTLRQLGRTQTAQRAYHLLASHCADVIFTLDLRYRVQYVTPSVLDRAGFTPQAMIGTVLTRFVHADDQALVIATYAAVAAGQERALVVHRFRHADGHWLWVEVELSLVRSNVTGAPVGIIGASRDVSKHKAAEMTLQAEQAFFQAVFEYTTDCLFVQRVRPDAGFAVERINAAAASSLGITALDAIGQSPQALFGEAYGDEVEAGLRRTLSAGQALWMEDHIADGVTWEVIEVPIPGASGEIERILMSARDVTEQRRVQEAELLLLAGQ